MSFYDYKCPKCNITKEIERSIKAKSEAVICECGSEMDRCWSVNPIQFKGDGWQSNDVKDKS